MCHVIIHCAHVCKDLVQNIVSSCWGMNASQVKTPAHRIKVHLIKIATNNNTCSRTNEREGFRRGSRLDNHSFLSVP